MTMAAVTEITQDQANEINHIQVNLGHLGITVSQISTFLNKL